MEKEKLYFTEITENEKRIINLIRTYVVPYESVEEYVDSLVEQVVQRLLNKAVRVQAFVEVMEHERDNKELSDVQVLARVNQYEDYIAGNKQIMQRHFNAIFADIIRNLEGEVKSIEVYSKMEQLEEEEKALDKIQNT